MLKNTVILILIFSSFSLGAQLTTLTTGGDFISDAGTISFSVGESFCAFEGELKTNNIQVGVQQTQTMFLAEYQLSTKKLILYPNPATNSVNIDISSSEIEKKQYQYIIYSYDGKRCKEGTITNQNSNSLDIEELAVGKYLFVIEGLYFEILPFIKL